mmetsp:Transcript_65102/g.172455  ORF Transcript_65102/g.172455 Transcript_65102/m.172455 type:complete len:323 (-) Transcript_65102:292-1260(-)
MQSALQTTNNTDHLWRCSGQTDSPGRRRNFVRVPEHASRHLQVQTFQQLGMRLLMPLIFFERLVERGLGASCKSLKRTGVGSHNIVQFSAYLRTPRKFLCVEPSTFLLEELHQGTTVFPKLRRNVTRLSHEHPLSIKGLHDTALPLNLLCGVQVLHAQVLQQKGNFVLSTTHIFEIALPRTKQLRHLLHVVSGTLQTVLDRLNFPLFALRFEVKLPNLPRLLNELHFRMSGRLRPRHPRTQASEPVLVVVAGAHALHLVLLFEPKHLGGEAAYLALVPTSNILQSRFSVNVSLQVATKLDLAKLDIVKKQCICSFLFFRRGL